MYQRGWIGTKQQPNALGFDRGEPFVLLPRSLDIVFDQLRSSRSLLPSLLAFEYADLGANCLMSVQLHQ